MKTISIFCMMCLLIPTSLSATDSEVRRLIKEREQQTEILKHLNDSMVPGRLTKLYLLNNQMQKILRLDDTIIRHSESVIKSESVLNDSLRAEEQKAAKLSLDNEQLIIRGQSDSRIILVMKASIGILILAVLVLLYFLVYRSKARKDYNKEDELDRLVKENNSLQSQISNFQFKEERIKAEIDKAVELKTASLQSQLDSANERNRSILNKIDKLIRDLSSVNQ